MAKVVFIEASPLQPGGTTEVAIRLAGGGAAGRAYTYKGFYDWRGGIANVPNFTAAIGFDESGWNGGAVPQTSAIRFMSSDRALMNYLGSLYWGKAKIDVTVGDDETGVYALVLRGNVAGTSERDGAMLIQVADVADALAIPIVTATYAGTGGLEGSAELTGKPKRRSLGAVFNVGGVMADPAYNIYEFGDPARPWRSIDHVRDRGAEATSYATVAWAGSADATMAALRAAVPAQGGCVVAPSIARAKWWTQAAGPLTADIKGESSGGYVQTVASILARILTDFPGITLADQAGAEALRPAAIGIHVDDTSTTVAQTLDRIVLPMGLVWLISAVGQIELHPWSYADPVADLTADTIARETTFPPMRERQVGYARNHRVQTEAEISYAVLYDDGTPISAVQPADAGATRNRFLGQWSSTNAYLRGDTVTNQGSAYTALQNVPAGKSLTDAAFWSVLAERGADGTPGGNGYVHFAYSNAPDGSVDFSTTDPTGRAYIGTYSDNLVPDSTDPAAYTWVLVKGEKGDPGQPGQPGQPGAARYPASSLTGEGDFEYPSPIPLEAGAAVTLTVNLTASVNAHPNTTVTVRAQVSTDNGSNWTDIGSGSIGPLSDLGEPEGSTEFDATYQNNTADKQIAMLRVRITRAGSSSISYAGYQQPNG